MFNIQRSTFSDGRFAILQATGLSTPISPEPLSLAFSAHNFVLRSEGIELSAGAPNVLPIPEGPWLAPNCWWVKMTPRLHPSSSSVQPPQAQLSSLP